MVVPNVISHLKIRDRPTSEALKRCSFFYHQPVSAYFELIIDRWCIFGLTKAFCR